MDASTAAALSALVVAVLAMVVAFAQMIQQYLITGQLIRICDSVVYGKMPGQGRRLWQKSQFRFRVVYRIPQICLRPDMWAEEEYGDPGGVKTQSILPDLCHSTSKTGGSWSWGGHSSNGDQKMSPYAAIPGEACWVSFSRMIQHSAGKDLYYGLVDGDADRCPSDLSVVPMQVSMRDIVTFSLMAGMRCTDVSFERKSLAMEGSAGTITSSLHPILGALIRFTPKNTHKPQGIRIRNGTIDPDWMARTWDVITIAGRQYTLQERRYYEAHEGGSWMTRSGDMTLAKTPGTRPSFRASSVRSRRSSANIRTRNTYGISTSVDELVTGVQNSFNTSPESTGGADSIPRSPQDGDWSFETETLVPSSTTSTNGPSETLSRRSGRSSPPPDLSWFERLSKGQRLKSTRFSCPASSIFQSGSINIEKETSKDRESDTMIENTSIVPQSQNFESTGISSTSSDGLASSLKSGDQFGSRMRRRQHLDGIALQKYIEDKKRAIPRSPPKGRLLLCWPSGDEPEEESETVIDKPEEHEDWRLPYAELKRERSASYADRWRDMVEMRQQRRTDRDLQEEWEFISRISSRSASVRSSSTFRRARSANSRSFSRDSRRSRRSSVNPASFSDEHRGRPRGRSYNISSSNEWIDPANPQRSRSESSGRPVVIDPRTGVIRKGSGVAYGAFPVQTSMEKSNKNKESIMESEPVKEESVPKRKPAVRFGFVEDIQPTDLSQETSKSLSLTRSTQAGNDIDVGIIDERKESSTRETPMIDQMDGSTSSKTEPQEARASEGATEQDRVSKGVKFDPSANIDDAQPSASETATNISERRKGILKAPRGQFPEEPTAYREGIAPLKDGGGKRDGIPPGARWTKIARKLVNPEALKEANERFEERGDHVIVLRVLTRDEIQAFADKTAEIRAWRDHHKWLEDGGVHSGSIENPMNENLGYPPSPPQESSRLGSPRKQAIDAGSQSPNRESVLPAPGSGLKPLKSEAWSEESVFGSNTESRISESPTPVSDDDDDEEEEWATFRRKNHRRAHRSSSESPTEVDGDVHFSNGSAPDDEAGAQTYPQRRRGLWNPQHATVVVRDKVSPQRHPPRRGSTSSTISLPIPEWDFEDKIPLDSDDELEVDGWDIQSNATTEIGDMRQIGGLVNWFWICQADVIPGYFATPWQGHFSEAECLGAIAVMRAALESFTDGLSLVYVDSLPEYETWLRNGKTTHPCYAINAMGGVIVSAKYRRVQFDTLTNRIPPIQLLRYPDGQSQARRSSQMMASRISDRTIVNRLSELMALDSWLSFCGRMPEIYSGRNNLVQTMPALVEKIMNDFAYEFGNVDRTAAEGGFQLITEMGQLVTQEMEDKLMLDEAEQLFTIVAILRAAKMALCVAQGPCTAPLRDILLRDVQVYMV